MAPADRRTYFNQSTGILRLKYNTPKWTVINIIVYVDNLGQKHLQNDRYIVMYSYIGIEIFHNQIEREKLAKTKKTCRFILL